jgi:RES domain-containing protein
VYRLSSSRYASHSGRGAALHAGRWNPPGVEAIYAAANPSLAALEILVHFAVLPLDFVLTEIHIPDGLAIEFVTDDRLPRDWDASSPIPATREFGGRWARELRSAVLSVPSSIIPAERNFVINPRHPEFPRIEVLPSKLFRFDPRLK